MRVGRFEPTYEELKLKLLTVSVDDELSFEPTYEELKPLSTFILLMHS